MTDLNIEHIERKIRDILQRCTCSNDNCAKRKISDKNDSKTNDDCIIRIVGNNNIIIEANFLYTTFIFLLSCLWMYLCKH